jgi:hypothetical protein
VKSTGDAAAAEKLSPSDSISLPKAPISAAVATSRPQPRRPPLTINFEVWGNFPGRLTNSLTRYLP